MAMAMVVIAAMLEYMTCMWPAATWGKPRRQSHVRGTRRLTLSIAGMVEVSLRQPPPLRQRAASRTQCHDRVTITQPRR